VSLWQQAWVGLDCGNPQSADALFARAPPSLGLPNARAVCALRTGDPQAALAFLTLVVDCHGAEILLVGRPNGLSRHARLGWGGGYAKHLVAPRRRCQAGHGLHTQIAIQRLAIVVPAACWDGWSQARAEAAAALGYQMLPIDL
jgi:hypothetical protein